MNNQIIENWKKLGDKATLLPCPRCGHIRMKEELEHNALSRRVDLHICPNCGTEESLEDYHGHKKQLEDWFLFSDVFNNETSVKKTIGGDFRLEVKRQISVSVEDVDDIMCSALEGGITYWCCEAEVVEDDYYGECASQQIARGGSLRLYDTESDEVYILTLEKFLNGIKLACRDGYGGDWFDGNELDCCQIDGEAADIIIQYAVFGEVVYG